MSARKTTPVDSSETRERASMSATEAQNNFGRVLDRAATEGTVYVTRYDRPAVVVLSIDRYRELAGEGAPELGELTREFDEMLARMQSAEAAAAVDALFEAGSDELGEAAVRGARARAD